MALRSARPLGAYHDGDASIGDISLAVHASPDGGWGRGRYRSRPRHLFQRQSTAPTTVAIAPAAAPAAAPATAPATAPAAIITPAVPPGRTAPAEPAPIGRSRAPIVARAAPAAGIPAVLAAPKPTGPVQGAPDRQNCRRPKSSAPRAFTSASRRSARHAASDGEADGGQEGWEAVKAIFSWFSFCGGSARRRHNKSRSLSVPRNLTASVAGRQPAAYIVCYAAPARRSRRFMRDAPGTGDGISNQPAVIGDGR